MSHTISVAMITMNEEKAVARVIGDIRSALGARPHEIIIVDSSRDATPSIATGLGAPPPEIIHGQSRRDPTPSLPPGPGARVLRQFPPQGYGRAMARVLQE